MKPKLEYPYNLLVDAFGEDAISLDEPLPEETLRGLEYAISLLPEQRRTALELRYKENLPMADVAAVLGLSVSRARQILFQYPAGSLDLLQRSPEMVHFIENGPPADDKTEVPAVPLSEIGLPIRAYHRLTREGYWTMADIAFLSETEIGKFRDFGTKSVVRVATALEQLGIEGTAWSRLKREHEEWERERRGNEAATAVQRSDTPITSEDMSRYPWNLLIDLYGTEIATRAALPENLDTDIEFALSHLSDAAKKALKLRYEDNLSYARIGENLNMQPTAAKNLIEAGRGALRMSTLKDILNIPEVPCESLEQAHKAIDTNTLFTYPFNLIAAVLGEDIQLIMSLEMDEDRSIAIQYALSTLQPNRKMAIDMFFRQGMSKREIGNAWGVTQPAVREQIARALRNLRHPSRSKFIKYGMHGAIERMEESAEVRGRKQGYADGYDAGWNDGFAQLAKDPEYREKVLSTPVESLDLTVRSYNCLLRSGCGTIGEAAALTQEQIKRIRNLGIRSICEVADSLYAAGVYISAWEELRQQYEPVEREPRD